MTAKRRHKLRHLRQEGDDTTPAGGFGAGSFLPKGKPIFDRNSEIALEFNDGGQCQRKQARNNPQKVGTQDDIAVKKAAEYDQET